ncbi:MAG: hypothetical protein LBD63_01385, partial [Mycoplasmataceae bacterium]|nr:hypothetical protein [Mycoplasmataceae bacterium]
MIQPEQIIYKGIINKYTDALIQFDQNLNREYKEFYRFCEIWKNNRLDKLAGVEKNINKLDRMGHVVDINLDQRVFKDMQTNIGNNVIKFVTAVNVANQGKNKSSPVKTKLSRIACIGNSQNFIHNEFNCRQSNLKLPPINNLKLLSNKYLDEQIRKDKRLQKMKEIAVKQNKTVGEIEQELK